MLAKSTIREELKMNAQLTKLGREYFICIPQTVADEIGVAPGDDIRLTTHGHTLVITATEHSNHQELAYLLEGYTSDTDRDIFAALDFGAPVGRELL
jgi:antitoxin component of MazEF toxin-antitoxin module